MEELKYKRVLFVSVFILKSQIPWHLLHMYSFILSLSQENGNSV